MRALMGQIVGSVVILALVAGWLSGRGAVQRGEERSMSDRKNIWSEVKTDNPMPGRRVRFFATWTGYNFPPEPRRPVDLVAAQQLQVYYQGTFEHIAGRDVLVRFEKFELKKTDVVGVQVPESLEASPFLALASPGDVTGGVRDAMTPSDVLGASEYFFRPEGTPTGRATHIRRVRTSSTGYAYDASGKFTGVID